MKIYFKLYDEKITGSPFLLREIQLSALRANFKLSMERAAKEIKRMKKELKK